LNNPFPSPQATLISLYCLPTPFCELPPRPNQQPLSLFLFPLSRFCSAFYKALFKLYSFFLRFGHPPPRRFIPSRSATSPLYYFQRFSSPDSYVMPCVPGFSPSSSSLFSVLPFPPPQLLLSLIFVLLMGSLPPFFCSESLPSRTSAPSTHWPFLRFYVMNSRAQPEVSLSERPPFLSGMGVRIGLFSGFCRFPSSCPPV